jgi:hypothetical protein
MSKNYSHDNIYSILGKLEALQPTTQEKHDATVQQIRESVEAQGSILKGLREVGSVEQRLAKQFAESKIEEKAVSQAQQKFMGMVHAAQKGSKAASPEVAKVAKSMGKKDARDFAATKHKGLPQHVNEKYDAVKAVKQCAKDYMEMNGIASVHDLEAEDIESIGGDCQMNYEDVCEILGCNLPDSLGPVKSWDTDAQGNKFDLEEATCNECGMTEGECEHTMSEDMSRAAKGYEKYGKKGMLALAKAGRDGASEKKLDTIRDKHDQYNEAEECCCKELGQKECPVHCDEEPRSIKEGETTRKDGVTTHRKTDFPGYPSDDLDDSEEDENKGKRGRPRKHAKKKDTGEKRGRGRPSKHSTGEKSSKDSLPFSSKNKMGHDPFGRVKSDADAVAKKDSKKDSKKTVAENMDNLARRLTEGVNFANLLKEKHQTVDEMLAELSNDMKLFKETGHCSELLRDCMEIKGYHGKMVADEAAQVPSKMDQFGKPDAFAHVKDAPKPPMGIPGSLPAGQIPGKSALLKGQGRNYYEEEDDSLASELDELAKLAGLSEVSRGEYIKQQDTDAEKSGKNKFNAFGQIFNTDEIKEEPNEGNAFTAGLEDDDIKIGDKIPGTNAIKTKDIDTVDEAKVDVKDAPESVNKPRPKFASIKTITTQGDDMNREKSQDPATANKAANPFTNKGSRVSEATLSLEAQLAAEYESIKKVN